MANLGAHSEGKVGSNPAYLSPSSQCAKVAPQQYFGVKPALTENHFVSPAGLTHDGIDVGFEDSSFENMVIHYRRALIRLNAGIASGKLLSKRDREHMRKLGIIVLTASKGRRYVITDRAKQILGILE